jgi:hypothetical protein
LFLGCEELPEQQQILIVQKRDAPREKANASQSRDMTFVPMVSLMPYPSRAVLNAPVRVVKRTVEVMAARKVKRHATYFCISKLSRLKR